MSDRLHVGTRKGLFTIERQPGGWRIATTAFIGDPVTMLLPDPRTEGLLYAALRHGHFGPKLHRSTDGGVNFSEITSPVMPADEGADDAPSVDSIWALESGGPDRADVLWCGTIPGALFKSDDAGASWDLVRSLWDDERRKEWFGGGADKPALHSICVDPRNSDHVLIGVSCGGVWVTRDAGATWQLRAEGMYAEYMPPDRKHDPVIQDPHCIVQCPAQPDRLWAQHHNGVFRSDDGVPTWVGIDNVPPSTFGFAVAVHPGDPDTAWFVPAVSDELRVPVDGKVVVARTRDGGKSFEALREGLPQSHAYDLTYRHALDIDETGDVLAFGSTTGALWITEDGGDHWQLVSSHLPPIYCVRFA